MQRKVSGADIFLSPNLLSGVSIILLLFMSFGCKTVPVKREIREVREITAMSPNYKFIKAHMKNGSAYVLSEWHFNQLDSTLNGHGTLLDLNRRVVESRFNSAVRDSVQNRMFRVHISEIALLETNDPGPSIAGGLAVVTGVSSVVTFLCIINPKACFGSCPTFYAQKGDTLTLQAEGFSSSIAPSLEKRDIDMLYDVNPSRNFEMVLTNEALETHSIRYANLLAFERAGAERIFAGPDGTFYRCPEVALPLTCQAQEEDCREKVARADGVEYFSTADQNDLNTREELIVTFPQNNYRRAGLVVGKRQTLLTTYLMYQGLAYMGNSATYWLAELERERERKQENVFTLLGGVEVYSQDGDGIWKFEGEINETGPIARDFNIIPISLHHQEKVTLRLRLNKGLWRLDYLALAEISEEVVPTVVAPSKAELITGSDSEPLERLTNDSEYLVTYPGDSYRIHYTLPFENAELFLSSKGYYLEWMRDEWLTEQHLLKLNQMINKPRKFLRTAAGAYKEIEPSMEKTFWSSRYVKK